MVDGFAGFWGEGVEFVDEFGVFVEIEGVNLSVIDHLLNLNIIGGVYGGGVEEKGGVIKNDRIWRDDWEGEGGF